RHGPQSDSTLLEKPAPGDEFGIGRSIMVILAVHSSMIRNWSDDHSLVMVSSKFNSTRDTTVQAASWAGVMPSGKPEGVLGGAANSEGFALGSANRSVSRCSSDFRVFASLSVGRRARQRRNA